MAKYNKEIVKHICELIESDSYSVTEICSLSGITKETYYTWLKEKADFSDAIKKAQRRYDEMIVAEAKKSLNKKVRGYSVTETKTRKLGENEETTIIEKHIQPDTAAIIFTLCNRDPDNWKNRQDTNVTGEMTLTSQLDRLSDDELENIINNGGKFDETRAEA